MKFKQKKISKQTLSDKIADALTIKPRADIEDDQIFNSKPSTVSRADYSSSDEDEATISDFRKQNVNLLSDISKKYEGKVVLKKDFVDSSDASGDENGNKSDEKSISTHEQDEESDDYSITKFQKQLQSDSDEDEKSEDLSDDASDGDDDQGEGFDISQLEEPIKEEFEHIKKQNISEEAKKGICVRNQLLLWEGLLEMRIHLQRCVNTANMMPMSYTYEQMKNSNEFIEESSTTISNVTNLLDKFLTLQNMLLKNYPETKSLTSKDKPDSKEEQNKKDSDEEIPSDTDNEEIPSDTDVEESTTEHKEQKTKTKKITKKHKLEDYDKDIETCHKKFKTFRDMTIQKWNEKTRLATAANIKNAPTNTILQQISYILSDRQKLIKRTQLKRSEYDIVGYQKEEMDQNSLEDNPTTRSRKDDDEYISEIFDDSDFYHQLLRELIECKSADITDPVQLSRQWIALQQMRSKMKRKVDTKATKGRKIKYVVHNPLVSYMAPEKATKWNDESTNELYSSLFGKIFEHNNVGLNVDLDEKK